MTTNEKAEAGAILFGSYNPICIDTNQEFFMSNYAVNTLYLQTKPSFSSVTIAKIIALGYTPEVDSFIQSQIIFRRCNICQSHLHAAVFGNWSNRLAFGVCPKCSYEIFFLNLSDFLTTSEIASDSEIRGMIG